MALCIMTVINGKRKRINTCSAAVLCYAVQCRSFGIKTTAVGRRQGRHKHIIRHSTKTTRFHWLQLQNQYNYHSFKSLLLNFFTIPVACLFKLFDVFVSLFNLQTTFNLQLPSTSSRWVTIFMYSVFSYASLSFNFRISGPTAGNFPVVRIPVVRNYKVFPLVRNYKLVPVVRKFLKHGITWKTYFGSAEKGHG